MGVPKVRLQAVVADIGDGIAGHEMLYEGAALRRKTHIEAKADEESHLRRTVGMRNL